MSADGKLPNTEQPDEERDEALFDYAALSKDQLITECKRLWNLSGGFLKDLTHERCEVSRLCGELLARGNQLTEALLSPAWATLPMCKVWP
jgi:hypothetical protein